MQFALESPPDLELRANGTAGRSSTQLQTREHNEGSGREGRERKTWRSQQASANGRQASRSVVVQCSCEPLMYDYKMTV